MLAFLGHYLLALLALLGVLVVGAFLWAFARGFAEAVRRGGRQEPDPEPPPWRPDLEELDPRRN